MMAFSFAKIKNFLNTTRDGQLAGSGSLEPEIGFKLSHNPVSKCLLVTVIGARHLPSLFGLTRAHGYLVKVKLFPGDNKFETHLQETSWPVWNEEFKFELKEKRDRDKDKHGLPDLASQLAGHFISLTIYALLETPKTEAEDKRKSVKEKWLNQTANKDDGKGKGLFEKKVFSSLRSGKQDVTQKTLLEKRRTVGAATWNFDSKLFQNDLKNGFVGTPDIWRPIQAITSGLAGNDPRRENKKGQVEVTLEYTSSEDGLNDVIQVTINRMRCSVLTMQEQEQLKAPLYLKVAIMELNKADSHWKSDRFLPTISARWDPKSSVVRQTIFASSLPKMSVYITLGCKNKMSKKEILGKATLGPNTAYAQNWKRALESPGIPVTMWLNLE